MPASTAVGSKFLTNTLATVNALVAAGHLAMTVGGNALSGNVVEIFPTVFMASLLPPHEYSGIRNRHTDDLWLKLIGRLAVRSTQCFCPALIPYANLVKAVEDCPPADLHDVRTAAISAIAADWFASSPPGSGSVQAAGFIGHFDELGFLLPPRAWLDPVFLTMLSEHWTKLGDSNLVWL